MLISKYELDFENTIAFFIEHIDWGTFISEKIVQKIDFKNGHFFTSLPKVADLKKMHDLRCGGILPQNKPKKLSDGSGVSVLIPNINPYICEYIHRFLTGSKERIVFCEYFGPKLRNSNLESEGANLSFCENDVNYFMRDGISLSQIESVIRRTQRSCHSIIIFLEGLDDLPKNLKNEDLEKICEHATKIATTAYDGEGFVFWERGKAC